MGHLFVPGLIRECCVGVMYAVWYGVVDFVVFLVVGIWVDYGGVNVFHVCFNLCVVYGVGGCVNVCGVVCVVVFVCFLRLGVVCCDVM